FGSHIHPLDPSTDMSLPGLAAIVAAFLAALELDNTTIVADDTGGAVAQSLVAYHPERITSVVLTSCDAFDKYPPPQRNDFQVSTDPRWLSGRITTNFSRRNTDGCSQSCSRRDASRSSIIAVPSSQKNSPNNSQQ
ncbi:MAG: alpha/beta hydrolase, partial [Acidimicrobiia bacterium]|nr:alpha/beta hydrolase [Acidimicrobiia bacterium]